MAFGAIGLMVAGIVELFNDGHFIDVLIRMGASGGYLYMLEDYVDEK